MVSNVGMAPAQNVPTQLGTNHLVGNAELQTLGINCGDDVFTSISLDLNQQLGNTGTDAYEKYYNAPGEEIAKLDAVAFDQSVLENPNKPFSEDPKSAALDEIAAKKAEMSEEDREELAAIIKAEGAQDFLTDELDKMTIEEFENEAKVFNNDFLEDASLDPFGGTIMFSDPAEWDNIGDEVDDYDPRFGEVLDPMGQDIALGLIKANAKTSKLKIVKK